MGGHRINKRTVKTHTWPSSFLLCFPKASIIIIVFSVQKWYKLYCVFRSGAIRKSVQAVDEKQDIFLQWPKLYSDVYGLGLV